jgi:chemotaxis protein MotB
MADEDKKINIIRKKKIIGGHGGHHGGAWKVAYADFVTAMMAFFMVMWLMGSDEETKEAVSHYFKHHTISRDGVTASGPFAGGDASNKSSGAQGRFEEKSLDQPSYAPPVHLEEYAILKDLSSYYEGSAFTVDTEGQYVRYKITPRLKFSPGSVSVSGDRETRDLIARLIDIFHQHDGLIVIEGFPDDKIDWAVAFGRAMAVKRTFEEKGINSSKLIPTAGYATGMNGRLKNLEKEDLSTVRFILKRKRY